MPNRTPPLALALTMTVASFAQSAPPATAPASRPAVAPPERAHFRLYLLMGQSNMVGRDTRTIAAQPADDPRLLAFTPDGHWTVARDPLHEKDSRIEPGVGPGMSFAREMLKADLQTTIGLIPCAVGGTPLRRWVKGGDLYERAVARAKAAQQAGVLAGVLWHQGESDSDQQETAETYGARLTKMIGDLRQDVGQPDLPVVVGQLGDFLTPAKHPYVETVRAAIQHLPAALPNVGYADAAGLGDKGDQLHFTAEAEQVLGRHFAEAMQALQQPHPNPTTAPAGRP